MTGIKLTKLITLDNQIYAINKLESNAMYASSLELIESLKLVKIIIYKTNIDIRGEKQKIQTTIYLPLNQIKYMENKFIINNN